MQHNMRIPYRIVKIENQQFAIFPELFVNGEEVKVESSFGFSHSTDLSMIRCITQIRYLQSEAILLVFKNATYFDIAPEGVNDIQKEGKVPVDFLQYMATIAVGTARGIIHDKTEGTVLNSVVLPPINLVEIIKEDLMVNKQ